MRNKRLVTIGLFSFAAVVSLVAAFYVFTARSSASNGIIVADGPKDVPFDFSKPGAVHPNQLVRGPKSIASGAMNSLNVRFDRDGIHVAAAATFWHRDDGNAFVWAVKVIDEKDNDTVVYRHRYDDQVAPMHAKETYTPTFEDVLKFRAPAGTYQLKLIAYIIPADSGAGALDDSKKAALYEAAVGTARVVIP